MRKAYTGDTPSLPIGSSKGLAGNSTPHFTLHKEGFSVWGKMTTKIARQAAPVQDRQAVCVACVGLPHRYSEKVCL
jgi:hypothetical protein